MNSPNHRVLCRLDEVADGASRGFTLQAADNPIELFVVREGDEVFAYRNRCPHTGAPLDWTPDRFLDNENRYIQCAMHGALFVIETGLCVYGPCVDRYLEPIGPTMKISLDAVGRMQQLLNQIHREIEE